MSPNGLRPLSIGEILDVAIKLYLRNARALIYLTAAVVIPFQALGALVLLSVVPNAEDIPTGVLHTTPRPAGDASASFGASSVLTITGLIVGLLTTAACVKAVSEAYLDHPIDARASLIFALRKAGSLLWMEIIMGVGLSLAFIALVIPGIWLAIAWSLATPALLIEGLKGPRALGRSRRLVSGRWWPVAGVHLFAGIMTSLVTLVLEGLLVSLSHVTSSGSVPLAVLTVSIAAGIASILTRPFGAAVTIVLYYDLRVRHEGFDLAQLAERLGIEPPAGSAEPLPFGPESVGRPGGPPFWPPPPGWTGSP